MSICNPVSKSADNCAKLGVTSQIPVANIRLHLFKTTNHLRGYCLPALFDAAGSQLTAACLTVETTYDRTRYDDYQFGITRATGAIAESGTVIIDDNRTSHRLAALSPQDHRLSEIHAKVERVVQGLRDANQSLREVARGLVPLQVESHGLNDALARLAAQIRELHAVDCRCSVDDGIDITDGGAATHLYRIAQEAVTNSLKHGSARQIEIRLCSRDQGLCLEVADDGVGVSETGENRGRGLQIMAYRAGLIGGVLTVRNADAGGTIVSCNLLSR